MDGERNPLLKEDLGSVIFRIALERLTKKQKHILSFIVSNPCTPTRLSKVVSADLKCSRSAIFNNLHSLERAGLVEISRGTPVSLTHAGRLALGGSNG